MNWEAFAIVATAVGGPVAGAYLSYKTLKRAQHVDEITERSGIATESRAGVQQIFDAQDRVHEQLQRLVDQVQEENKDWRVKSADLNVRLDACFTEREALRRELNRMYRKYGNGDTPPAGTPTTT